MSWQLPNQAAVRSRTRAEQRENMALKAIDNYRNVVETTPELLTRADLKPLRQRLLDEPLGFYRLLKEALVREMSEPSPPAGLDDKSMLANFALAWLNAESGSPVNALKSYQEAVDILKPVVDRTEDPFKRRDLAMVCNNLGNLQVEIGRFDDARTTHEKARAASGPGAGVRTIPVGSLTCRTASTTWAADSKVGQPDSALTHYRRAAELREKVVDGAAAGRDDAPSWPALCITLDG